MSAPAAQDAALAPLTTLRVGGPARRLVEAHDERTLVDAVLDADGRREPVLVLGGGSNVVIADEGFDGTAVHVLTRGVDETAPGVLRVAAGEPWDPLVERTVREGRAGFEALSGIPGSTGATPIQNVGAYGQEVAETIRAVRVLDRADGAVRDLPAGECGFAYRRSRFKGDPRWVVLSVDFALCAQEAGDRAPSAPVRYAELARRVGVELEERAPLRDVREAVLALRRGKGMVVDPDDPDSVSAGSFFTNPVLDAAAFAALERRAGEGPPRWPQPDGRLKTSAAWLIERAGFHKGWGEGRAGLSTKHTLALVNRGGASAAELVAAARAVADGVRDRFGVDLVPEPVFVGHTWR